jgi:hypothetical protein
VVRSEPLKAEADEEQESQHDIGGPQHEETLSNLRHTQRQKAKFFELRASLELARLWRDQGSGMRLASFSLRCAAGLPKDLTRAIWFLVAGMTGLSPR